MRNRDLSATWRYHEATKHSYERLQGSRHFLDWANQPIPYKIYSSLEPIPLPSQFPSSPVSALEALAETSRAPAGECLPDLTRIARLCFFSNGITKRRRFPGGEIAFRAAACTGALYHVELYLVCTDLPGLEGGVYHFGAHDNGLRRLRPGDFRQVVVEATGGYRSPRRRFASQPIAFEQLSTMLDHAVRSIPADCLDPMEGPLSDVYLIVNAVDGLSPGAYVLRRAERALELLKPGKFRGVAGRLALGQELGAAASVNVYFLTDLEPVLARFGNRGYRAAQLTSAIVAGKLYLAAYALRLGATGLTFLDDDVTAFFSPHSEGKSMMFLLALGRPVKQSHR